MSIASVLNKHIDERGITKAELSRRVNMNPDLLSRSLNEQRKFRADELIALCEVLNLDLQDFSGLLDQRVHSVDQGEVK